MTDSEYQRDDLADIVTPRLQLRLLREDVLSACLRGDRDGASQLLGCRILDEFFYAQDFMAMRILQLRNDAGYTPFGPRALVLTSSHDMVGHIGFHTPPDPDYLRPTLGTGIEIGYTVAASRRRVGFAEEALRAMIDWANARHHVTRFVASIAPTNVPSQRLAAKIGFKKITEQIDEVDGPEDVLLLRVPEDCAPSLLT